MNIIKLKNEIEVAQKAAEIIENQIKINNFSVLGLATGSSPILTYENLIKSYKKGEISFANVKTFNLDEYKGLQPTHPQSYRYFMNEKLFNHIDINIKNTFVPEGVNNVNPEAYDQLIKDKGGIDLQLLGLGVNGHIGFNEPGTSFDSLTSEVDLAKETIEVNSKKFFNGDLSEVPTKAYSMGLKSIMNSKKILLIATGSSKAEAIHALVNSEISENWPCTVLRNHNNVTIVIDEEAGKLI
ncbi:glucosamine-6-phosphate deaminase [Mesoplasma chauliocola]|uniref:Glucosamine-6-phosphate deaminase n=1 Tax=Mesoplasma chauliocola TaxID=216427 RepID=A0A249SPC0_9MOLU|nr:glucosamine-6-phosphate deaminase [Mesoplasma chauliocola]ASZ09443.1 glucosamine-6-phosphate deaminase [Mesoplasma chauliocola]